MQNFNQKNSSRKKRYTQISDINVTPFVDVMLVLLIVFMVTAPLLTVGIPVDLPKVKANALTDQKAPIEITVKLDGSVFLGESIVEIENLIPRLNAISDQNNEVFVETEKAKGNKCSVCWKISLQPCERHGA